VETTGTRRLKSALRNPIFPLVRRNGNFEKQFQDSVRFRDDYAFMQFDLDTGNMRGKWSAAARERLSFAHCGRNQNTDLSRLWHWNTKELFVLVMVEYATRKQMVCTALSLPMLSTLL
jgi:hypothetical protein